MNPIDYRDYISQYTDPDALQSALENLDKTFRINTLKCSREFFERFSEIPRKPRELPNTFSCDREFPLGKTMEFFTGMIHTQTMSSMVPPFVLEPKPNETVLDLAAAPGGKTTQISGMMRNTGVVVANDVKFDRLSVLVGNIRRLGALNVMVTRQDGRHIQYRETFDRVLLDAPCSSMGSSLSAFRTLDRDRIRDMARVQRKLVVAAFDSLKKGGTMVYSTCTFSREENEEVIKFLLENRPGSSIADIGLDLPHDCGLSEYGKEFRKAWRIQPKHLNSEGFFIARMGKQG